MGKLWNSGNEKRDNKNSFHPSRGTCVVVRCGKGGICYKLLLHGLRFMIRAQRAAWLVFLMKMGQNKMFVGLAGDSKRKDGSATAVNSFLSFSQTSKRFVCAREALREKGFAVQRGCISARDQHVFAWFVYLFSGFALRSQLRTVRERWTAGCVLVCDGLVLWCALVPGAQHPFYGLASGWCPFQTRS